MAEIERYSILGSEISSLEMQGDEIVFHLKKPQFHIEYKDYLMLMRNPARKADAQTVHAAVLAGKVSVV